MEKTSQKLLQKLIVHLVTNAKPQPEMTGPRSEYFVKCARKIVNAADRYAAAELLNCNGREVELTDAKGKLYRTHALDANDHAFIEASQLKARRAVSAAMRCAHYNCYSFGVFGLSIQFADGTTWSN